MFMFRLGSIAQATRQSISMRAFSGSLVRNNKKPEASELLVAISDLSYYGIELDDVPIVLATGEQSSGKSSVVEAIIAVPVLPKDMGRCTRKPIDITLIRSNKIRYVVGDREFTTVESTKREIQRLNSNKNVESINVIIYRDDVYNTKLRDMPGLYSVKDDENDDQTKNKDDPSDDPKAVKAMTVAHLQKKNIIPLIVIPAPSDPSTSKVLELLNRYKKRQCAIGALTKFDLTSGQNTGLIEQMLQNKKYSTKGWFGLVLRNSNDETKGVSIADKIQEEHEFFRNKPQFRPYGVEALRKKISEVQCQEIQHNIPALLKTVDAKIQDLLNSESFLTNLVNDPNKGLAIKLELLIRKLVGSSMERAKFEEALRLSLQEAIVGYMGTISQDDDSQPEPVKHSPNSVDTNILNYHNTYKTKSTDLLGNDFENLFGYADISPILVNSDSLKRAFENQCKLGATLPLLNLVVRDDQGEKRLKWNTYLRRYFVTLLTNDNILNVVYKITINMILEYLNNDPETSDELTKKFAEYIVNVIGSEAYNSNIKYNIIAMVNTEKRPYISLSEFTKNYVKMYPNHLQFNSTFTERFTASVKCVEIELYDEIWNHVYLKTVADKLALNIYRNIAVHLLDQMVRNLLEMTIDMFNKQHAEDEKIKVSQKIEHLRSVKKILQSHIDADNMASGTCESPKKSRVISDDDD